MIAFEMRKPGLGMSLSAERVAERRRLAHDYAAQQKALDEPFAPLIKARAMAKMGEASGGAPARSAGAPLGLVSNATSGTNVLFDAHRPIREKLLINREAQRVKRLRTKVGHAARILHFDAHRERHAQRWNKKLITLTYERADDWQPGHIAKWRDAVRHWCKRRGVKMRYVWVAEIQTARFKATGRAVVHYHVVLWLPKGHFLPFYDVQGWWPHGDSNTKDAQSPISYIAKYASKTTAADASMYPKGARMYGVGGLTPPGREEMRFWMAPFWVRDAMPDRADIRKCVGGYVNANTGEFLPSPWKVFVGPGGQVWTYRTDQSETLQ